MGPVTVRGRRHAASDLRAPKKLRKLLTFASPTRRPHLAVILVDEDGDRERRRDILGWTTDLDLPRVVAVPIREFEAWLIADQRTLASVLSVKETPRSPESMQPGEAKRMIQFWIAEAVTSITGQEARGTRTQQLRLELVQQSDLLVLDRLSAFRAFRDDLRAAMSAIP